MGNLFKAIGVLAVGLVLLVVLAAVLFSGNGSSISQDLGLGSSGSDATPYTLTYGERNFRGEMASNVGVAILGVTSQPFIYSPLGLSQADGKYVIVRLAVSNQQTSQITIDNNLFELVDPQGTVYSSSAKSMEVGERNDLFLAGINPGITKSGVVIFDVPTTLDVGTLQLRFRGGMTGDTETLPLAVQEVSAQHSELAPVYNESTPQATLNTPVATDSSGDAENSPSDTPNTQSTPQTKSGTPATSLQPAVQQDDAVANNAAVASAPRQAAVGANGPYKIGGNVSAPVLISSAEPAFPEEARQTKIGSNVLVNLWVGTDGLPSHVRAIRVIYIDHDGHASSDPFGMSNDPGFEEKAVEAVKQYRFKPAMDNGKPVVVEINVEVNFKIF